MKNGIIYSLSIEDLQTVAVVELGRKLTTKEIKLIKEKISDRISWYDIIANIITEKTRK